MYPKYMAPYNYMRRQPKLEEEYQAGTLPQVFELIEVLAKKLKQMQRVSTREAGLTPPQYVLMSALWEREGRPLKELADICFCTPATITGIVDTLEGKGLVMRQSNPQDRRSLLVVLTPAGRALEETAPSMESLFHDCCDALGEAETRDLARLLNKLNESLPFSSE